MDRQAARARAKASRVLPGDTFALFLKMRQERGLRTALIVCETGDGDFHVLQGVETRDEMAQLCAVAFEAGEKMPLDAPERRPRAARPVKLAPAARAAYDEWQRAGTVAGVFAAYAKHALPPGCPPEVDAAVRHAFGAGCTGFWKLLRAAGDGPDPEFALDSLRRQLREFATGKADPDGGGGDERG